MSRKVSSTIRPQLISKFHYIWAPVHFKGSVIFWNKQDHVTPPYNILHWLLRTFRSACTLPPTKASRVPQVSSLLASHAPIPSGHSNAINHVHNCSMSPTPVTESPLSTTPFLLCLCPSYHFPIHIPSLTSSVHFGIFSSSVFPSRNFSWDRRPYVCAHNNALSMATNITTLMRLYHLMYLEI